MRCHPLFKPILALLLVLCLLLPAAAQDTGALSPEAENGSEDPPLYGAIGTDAGEYIVAEEDCPVEEPWLLENETADGASDDGTASDREIAGEGIDIGSAENRDIILPPSLSPAEVWNASARERITSTSITGDGSHAVAATHRPGTIYYFDSSGAVQWRRPMEVPVFGVAISPDGTHVAAAAEKLYLLYPHGGEIWSEDSGYFVYSVAVSRGGERIAAGYDDGTVRLFDRDGHLLWSYTAGDDVISTAIAADGSYVAAGSEDHHLYFLDGSGGLLWKYRTGDGVQGVALSADGSLVGAGSGDRVAYVLDGRGNLLWKYAAENRIRAVSVSPEGALVAICEGSRLHLFDREGRSLWELDTGSGGRQVSTSSTGATAGPAVTAAALSSQGLHLVVGTGSGDRRVLFYAADAAVEPSVRSVQETGIRAPVEALEASYLQDADDGSVRESAYVSSITRLGPHPHDPVAVRIAVSPHWLAGRPGGAEGIRILERTENGTETMLKTTIVGYDLRNNTIFEAVSGNRSAVYGLASGVTDDGAAPTGEWWSLRSLLGGGESGAPPLPGGYPPILPHLLHRMASA